MTFFETLGTMRSAGNTIGPSSRILSQSGLTNIQKTGSVNKSENLDGIFDIVNLSITPF